MNPTLSVAVLDGARKLGAKILVSGGGRCNVTNAVVTEHDFWGGRPTIVRSVLRAFPVKDTVTFFEDIGVALHEEYDGKLFPNSNRARDVLDRLLREAARVGVSILTEHRINDVIREQGGFRLTNNHGAIAAKRAVLATGGQSLPKSGSDGTGYRIAQTLGHTIVPTTPALAPLVLDDDNFHGRLSGISHEAEITVWVDNRASIRLQRPLLWTHFGISGPVVMNASRHWARARLEEKVVRVTLNFVPRALSVVVGPSSSFEAMDASLVGLITTRRRASVPTLLSGPVPAAVASALTDKLRLDQTSPASQLSRADRRRLVHALVEWPLPIVDTRGYNYAEATAGGVDLAEINPSTLESRVCSGLYLVGEVLDVDGRIGGFNFQWAWSSAYVAARALAGSKKF